MKKITILFLIMLVDLGVLHAQSSQKTKVITDYFDTYNNHQVDSLMIMVSSDFKMYSVSHDTTTLDINGKEALRKWLSGYFNDLPNVSSSTSGINVSGNYVSFIETAHWGENKSQSSLAVYEIENGKIRRVWYYY